MSVTVKLTRPAQRQKNALPNDQARIVGKMIHDLEDNPFIGTLYQTTKPVTYAYAGSQMTICFTLNHPTDPSEVEINAVFETNLRPIDEYEAENRRKGRR